MNIHSILIGPLLLASAPVFAQAPAPFSGAAGAELVSRSAAGEVHLIVDPTLNDRRLVMKMVVLNRTAAPQLFGPEAVAVTLDGAPLPLATRDELLGRRTGLAERDTSGGRAAASLPTNGAGQTDVTGFTGGMVGNVAGVPVDSVARAGRGQAAADPLDAVLLKPMTIAPGKADGGQLYTARLRKRGKPVEIAVTFAGEVHRFALVAPK